MNNHSEMESRIISLNLGGALIKRMDSRTKQLDTDRSKYVRHLIREDLSKAVSAANRKQRGRKGA